MVNIEIEVASLALTNLYNLGRLVPINSIFSNLTKL